MIGRVIGPGPGRRRHTFPLAQVGSGPPFGRDEACRGYSSLSAASSARSASGSVKRMRWKPRQQAASVFLGESSMNTASWAEKPWVAQSSSKMRRSGLIRPTSPEITMPWNESRKSKRARAGQGVPGRARQAHGRGSDRGGAKARPRVRARRRVTGQVIGQERGPEGFQEYTRIMTQIRNPTTLVYILVHVVLVLLGLLVISANVFADLIGDVVSKAVGASLVAAGIAGGVVYLHVRLTNDLKDKVRTVFLAGIVNVFPTRSARIKNEYDQRLNRAREIDILALGLSAFREDYYDQMGKWCKQAKIRILVIDPEFPRDDVSYARQRDLEENNAVGQIKTDAEMFIKTFKDLCEKYPENLKIKKYKVIPSVNILRADDEMFWGPYIIGTQSRNMPTLIVKRGGFIFESLQDHFGRIWNDSRFSEDILNAP